VNGRERPGRPRATVQERRAASGREEILDASAELFATQGYAATSTRAIAEAVGIRQASLYYHFASKDQIMAELLAETVRPSIAYSQWLEQVRAGAAEKLWSVTYVDVDQLAANRWNVAALYLLPEVRNGPFAEFHQGRLLLKATYADLIGRCLSSWAPEANDGHVMAEFIFALVESVERIRADDAKLSLEEFSGGIACAALRMLRCPSRSFPSIERRGRRLVERYRGIATGDASPSLTVAG
jgi:AcrR family transcriptional regulator